MLDEGLDLPAVNRALNADSLEVDQGVIPKDPMYVHSPDGYFEARARPSGASGWRWSPPRGC
jgi:hypothetical protein